MLIEREIKFWSTPELNRFSVFIGRFFAAKSRVFAPFV